MFVIDSEGKSPFGIRTAQERGTGGRIDMYSPKYLGRYFAFGFALCSILVLSSGCVASRKYVRGEVHTSADQLNARVDKTDGNVKEMNDRVGSLDTKTNEQGRRLDTLN